MNDERVPHLTEVPEKPREPGLAGRIAQVRKFKDIAGMRKGLCPSCLGSGFLHSERSGSLGVVYRVVSVDREGRDVARIERCHCPLGQAKTSGEQEVKRLVESVDDDQE